MDETAEGIPNARAQLERARALGYGKKSDFDTLYQQLKEIDEKTADNKYGADFFTKILSLVTPGLGTIRGQATGGGSRNDIETSVAVYFSSLYQSFKLAVKL